MSTTDPNPNPPTRSGWASPAPSSPDTTRDPGGPPSSTSVGAKARTIVGGIVPRLIGLAVALALAFAGYWFFVVHKNSDAVAESIPKTGSCFSWTDAKGAKTLPCTDVAAAYKAEGSATGTSTAAGTRCESLGAYVEFGVTATRRNNSQSATICAALNLKVGDCAHQDVAGGTSIIPCAQAIGDDVKVISLQKVASAAESLSASKAMAVCGASSTQYLSDRAGTTIVCVGKP